MKRESEINEPLPLEAELIRNLRMIAPKEREHLLGLYEVYVELFPSRPALRLVKFSN